MAELLESWSVTVQHFTNHRRPRTEKSSGFFSRYRVEMESAIAQIVAENKNGNARTAGAIRVFPFRFDKDILKIIAMQREF
jgi:hypothetical protein